MSPILINGRIAARPAAELAALPWPALVDWCYRNARYTLVTHELVAWLGEQIAGRTAIEIGAGQGDLGFALDIPMTDSGLQTDHLMALLARASGSAPTNPPPDVERLDAAAAVAKYRPQVVIGSWITQLYRPGDDGPPGDAGPPKIGSSIYGVDEIALIDSVETYIHIGNRLVHGDKRALAVPHSEHSFPWLWSRTQAPEWNRIWVWNREQRV